MGGVIRKLLHGFPGTIHLAVVEARCVHEVILDFILFEQLWLGFPCHLVCCCGLTVPTTTIAISHGSARRYSVNASVNSVHFR